MNCFQNLLPLWYITTLIFLYHRGLGLWIAFRIYYLCDTSQLRCGTRGSAVSCELLSEFITFVIHHNQPTVVKFIPSVVNCFQNLLPLWYITTQAVQILPNERLWIAFRIYYLCDTSQPCFTTVAPSESCELLSEFITFVIHHNSNFI